MRYELVQIREDIEVIKRTDKDGKESYIPKDESNSDYQHYLRWLENPDADESGTL